MKTLKNNFALYALIIGLLLTFSHTAQAQLTLTVTRTDDRNPTTVTCIPGGDCSLREAVTAANMAPTNDTIDFAIPASDCTAGVCTITLTLGELAINNATTAGTLTITNTTGASNLLISGNNTSRVFNLNSGANLTINGITITNGNATTGTTGGGIFNNGTLTLTNSTVSGNTASNSGGIFNDFGGTLTLTNSTVSGNTGVNGGGGIFNNGTLTLTNSTVSGNTANGGSGGGIYNSSGTTTLTSSTVSGNTAGVEGGGIYNRGGGTTLTNSIVSGNTAGVDGGGILLYIGSTTTLTNSTVSGNMAVNNGGGIFNRASAFTLTNSTVSSNTARNNGGGIYNLTGTTLTTLTNSTVSGNTASNSGGGIFNTGGRILNLTSVTVTRNNSTSTTCTICAGGIDRSTGTTNLKNTIVAGNTVANAASSPDFRGAVAAGSAYNLIGDGTGTTGISNGDANSNQVGVDPLLDPTLQLNGGTTLNHALLAGSPAIDKGNSFTLTTDQRGMTRPFDNPSIMNAGDGADIGSFEVQQFAPTAALVTISGRVSNGKRGIARAIVYLTDQNGNVRTARTNPFGYYRFTDVEVGQTLIFNAFHKQYQFDPQVVSLNESLDNLNFTPQNSLTEQRR